jgi:Skp family chaperone for outer membrane proteins
MWKQFYEWAKWLFLLAQEMRQIRADVNEMQRELEQLTATVRDLAYEVRRNKENETHEREKLILKLDNAFLRFERRLTSGNPSEESKDEE